MGNGARKIKWGRRWEGTEEEGVWGKTTNTKVHIFLKKKCRKICPMVLFWHNCYESNQTLSDGKQGTLQKIECMSGPVNGDKNLKLG